MPEGHTLRRLAQDLNAVFAGTRPRISSPQGRFADSAALVDGQPWAGADSYGKHLFLGFGDRSELVIHIHLGLIGSLRFDQPLAAPARLRIEVDEHFAELRGPQTCALITPAELVAVVARLGPDPLRADADPEIAWQRIHRSGKSIAALLMDQSVIAGIGNVYRAEVLFRNRINPFTAGSRLKRTSWLAIWSDLVQLMPLGVRDNRIDTVRPEHTPEAMGRDPRVDDHGGEVYVYRRNDLPCLVCGSRIRTKVVEGRNLFWCGNCQRRS
ncbi:Fpg/Nei family DNA glycosylase [Naumannella halotolerans]|uniref:DNA-(apurinic or apyrimidinic site) lyase n=1 Tax=Naumannella halotolerans TaxID=993414 RepID=A0A4R7J9P7_9ACTN|nr:DNA-formamidopyrimidine glycosylase family protein [Naumannella halotolerans]TDT34024.1 endonuclease-8 [Naumannella halotolerans]